MKKFFITLALMGMFSAQAFAISETVLVSFPNGINTKALKAGDSVAVKVESDVVSDGKLILKKGATGKAAVTNLIKPAMWGRAAKLTINNAEVPDVNGQARNLKLSMYQEGVNRIALSIWVWPWIKGRQIEINNAQVFRANLVD